MAELTLDPATLLAGEQTVEANGIEIAYQTFGDPSDPTLLLVMGLGTQMIGWPNHLCEALADAGHHVVRFDNRDIGRSTHLGGPAASLPRAALRRESPYRLDDMADDAFGLLDALGIERFHLAGASMGGMISQLMAIAQPERVRSLSLIMTTTGSRRVGRPVPKLLKSMATRAAAPDRAGAIADAVATWSVIGSPDHLDLDAVRELAGISYDRSYDPAGVQRQLAAAVAAPDRTPRLRQLRVPTVVLHGLSDPLVTPSGGLALAKAIPEARFVGYHGMAHDLPRTRWEDVRDELLAVAARAEA